MGTKKAKCHAHEFHHRHVSSRLVSSAGCLCHEQCISTSPIVTTSPSSALPSCHPLDCAKLTCLNSKTHHNHVHVDLRARGCHRFSNPFTACSCVSLKPLHSSVRGNPTLSSSCETRPRLFVFLNIFLFIVFLSVYRRGSP